MTVTTRFALPLLHAGQAQKEMFHNEAIVAIDALLHPVVQDVGLDVPPATPEPGAAWIVGAAPTGDWTDHADAIATWTEGGWRFATPRTGMAVWSESAAQPVRYHEEGGWELGVVAATRIDIGGVQVVGDRGDSIPLPAGGATIDTQARDAITAILAALQAHGLIADDEL